MRADESSFKNIRDLAVESCAVSALEANPRNARTHSKRQVEAIAGSIRAFGFTNPVLVDDAGKVLAGHGRLAAAKLLGLASVPTIRICDLSEAQKRAYVLADNRLAERAGWDRATLALELGELSVLLPDLGLSVDLTGFEVGEIDGILAAPQEDTKKKGASAAADADDEVPPEPSVSVSRPGDLWRLGEHRLLCGDARDRAAVRQLMGEEQANVVFMTPYPHLPVGGDAAGNGRIIRPELAMTPGGMNGTELTDLLRVVLKNAADVSRAGALAFIGMDWRHAGELLQAGRAAFGDLEDLVVWEGANGGLGSLYRGTHELIGVFKVGYLENVEDPTPGKAARKRTNVWHYAAVGGCKADRADEMAFHPPIKPVRLVADAINEVTHHEAIVLDLFGAGGTTLIACERTARHARLLEFEPRHVDVTIRRFEKLFKINAIHAETGASYCELAQSRQSMSMSE
jgi:ParB-like chromosome segregation protein Spo0J